MCQYVVNALYSLYYLQYDSNTNTGTFVQILFSGVTPFIGSYFTLTPNGRFFAFTEATGTYMFRLYEKIEGSYL